MKNIWGIVVVMLLVWVGLFVPARVIGIGGDDCPCGMSGGGCKSCSGGEGDNGNGGPYCDKPGGATDPLCGGGGCEGYSGEFCPPGTTRSNVIESAYCMGSWWCGIGTKQTIATATEQNAINVGNTIPIISQSSNNRGTRWPGQVMDECGYCRNVEVDCDCKIKKGEEVCKTCIEFTCLGGSSSDQMLINYRCDPVCPAAAPTCGSAAPQVATTTDTTGTFYAYAYNVVGASTVKFPTWSSAGGQDDIVWYNGTNMGGGTWRAAINLAAHSASKGVIYVHVYMDATASCFVNTWCGTANFTIVDNQIRGRVYYDPTNSCAGTGKSDVTVLLDSGAGSDVTDVNGDFSVTADESPSHTLAVSMPTGFSCSSAVGCSDCSKSSILSPSQTGNDFYITDLREAWWQTEGAGIYVGGMGGGVTLRSELPDVSTALILPGAGTVGALLRASGSIDTGSGVVSDEAYNTLARYRGKKMGYDYFSAHMGVIQNSASDWTTSTISQSDCIDGEDFCFGGSGTTGVWDVQDGEKYVVFVNGDLRIGEDILIEPGGFLAFIVNGDISVDPTVAEMHGLYVMDDNFITETVAPLDDGNLSVSGSVVAWGAFTLGRDLGVGNTNIPAEKFTYRPDLLTNMPDKMKVFAMQWQEVVPGSFEEQF